MRTNQLITCSVFVVLAAGGLTCHGAVLYDFGNLQFSTSSFLEYGNNYIPRQEMLSCTGPGCGALGLSPEIAPGPNGAKTYWAAPFTSGGLPILRYEVPTDLQHYGTFESVTVSPWDGPVSGVPEPGSVGPVAAALVLFGIIAWQRRTCPSWPTRYADKFKSRRCKDRTQRNLGAS
jgi:hypothetical protein